MRAQATERLLAKLMSDEAATNELGFEGFADVGRVRHERAVQAGSSARRGGS